MGYGISLNPTLSNPIYIPPSLSSGDLEKIIQMIESATPDQTKWAEILRQKDPEGYKGYLKRKQEYLKDKFREDNPYRYFWKILDRFENQLSYYQPTAGTYAVPSLPKPNIIRFPGPLKPVPTKPDNIIRFPGPLKPLPKPIPRPGPRPRPRPGTRNPKSADNSSSRFSPRYRPPNRPVQEKLPELPPDTPQPSPQLPRPNLRFPNNDSPNIRLPNRPNPLRFPDLRFPVLRLPNIPNFLRFPPQPQPQHPTGFDVPIPDNIPPSPQPNYPMLTPVTPSLPYVPNNMLNVRIPLRVTGIWRTSGYTQWWNDDVYPNIPGEITGGIFSGQLKFGNYADPFVIITPFGRDIRQSFTRYILGENQLVIGDFSFILSRYYVSPIYGSSRLDRQQWASMVYDYQVELVNLPTEGDRIPQPIGDNDMPPRPPNSPDDLSMKLRELQQTIVIEDTDVVPSPLGGVTTTSQPKTLDILGFPGKTSGWQKHFENLSEMKKNLAKSINEARAGKLWGRVAQFVGFVGTLATIHNALMLSRDIGQTLFSTIFSAIDNAAKVIDDIPIIGNLINTGDDFSSAQFISKKLEDIIKAAIGESNWNDVKGKWASFNQITSAASTLLMSVRSLQEEARQLAELAAENSGKLANKMRRDGVLSDEGSWFPENYGQRGRLAQKLEKMNEAFENVSNTAQIFESITSSALSIDQNIDQIKEDKKNFDEALKKNTPKPTINNEKIDAQSQTDKAQSQGTVVTDSDTKATGDSNP